jgi:NADH dehydrogenase FAD-containing subunit
MKRHRFLFFGGGSAAKRDDVEVTIISRDNFILFTPMLDEVASGDLEPAHICNPLRRVTVLNGDIKAIDIQARQVRSPTESGRLPENYPLIISFWR